jgi:hypothetical protein
MNTASCIVISQEGYGYLNNQMHGLPIGASILNKHPNWICFYIDVGKSPIRVDQYLAKLLSPQSCNLHKVVLAGHQDNVLIINLPKQALLFTCTIFLMHAKVKIIISIRHNVVDISSYNFKI